MGYYINFEKVSLSDYKMRLLKVHLVPSRMLLRDNIDEQFAFIAGAGISNIDEFLTAVKTSAKLQDFIEKSGVEENYLKILKREINSTIPKPNKFIDFPNLEAETVEKLENIGIKKTSELYEQILTPNNRTVFAEKSGLSSESVLRLAQLTDLSRVQWVNHTFAAMLYELGYETAEMMAAADPETLHTELNRLNKEKNIYHHGFGLADMERCIFAAGEIPVELEI